MTLTVPEDLARRLESLARSTGDDTCALTLALLADAVSRTEQAAAHRRDDRLWWSSLPEAERDARLAALFHAVAAGQAGNERSLAAYAAEIRHGWLSSPASSPSAAGEADAPDIRLPEPVEADIDAAYLALLASEGASVADRWRDGLLETLARLPDAPETGEPAPESADAAKAGRGLRRLWYGNRPDNRWRILYAPVSADSPTIRLVHLGQTRS